MYPTHTHIPTQTCMPTHPRICVGAVGVTPQKY